MESLAFLARVSVDDGGATIIRRVISDENLAGVTEFAEHELKLANGAAEAALGMGGVASGRILWLTADREIAVKLDSVDSTPITVAASGCLMLIGAFTAVYLSNASGEEATVKALIAG